MKVVFDTSLTLAAALLAMIFFYKLNGVREGTVISALAVGQIVKVFGSFWKYNAPS